MKRLIYLFGLFFITMVFAIEQPTPNLEIASINQPIPPDTGTIGECTPFQIIDEYCSGDIRHYTQCIQTASGGKYQLKSENCKDYGSNVICFMGKCQKEEEKSKTLMYGGIAIAFIIAVVLFSRRAVR